jgi:hypothetical protein
VKSHEHAVDGKCPDSCKTYMDGLKKKMDDAKARVAKMKALATSHASLADKKEQHLAHRSINPMEEVGGSARLGSARCSVVWCDAVCRGVVLVARPVCLRRFH